MSKIYVIGVAGGTGSGKSTIARNVVEVVGHANVTTATQLFSNPIYIAIPYVIIVITIVFAVIYFKNNQSKFAERV